MRARQTALRKFVSSIEPFDGLVDKMRNSQILLNFISS